MQIQKKKEKCSFQPDNTCSLYPNAFHPADMHEKKFTYELVGFFFSQFAYKFLLDFLAYENTVSYCMDLDGIWNGYFHLYYNHG